MQTAGLSVACKAKVNFGSIKKEDREVLAKHGSLAIVTAPATSSKPLNTSRYNIQALHLADQPRSKSISTDSRQVSVAVERTTHREVAATIGKLHSNNSFALCHFAMMRSVIQARIHMHAGAHTNTHTCMRTQTHTHTGMHTHNHMHIFVRAHIRNQRR